MSQRQRSEVLEIMKIDDIIEIGIVDHIKNCADPEKYFFWIITLLVSRNLYDYCLMLYDGSWTSRIRVDDEFYTLPAPTKYEIDHLLDLLTNIWPQPVNNADFGGFNKACIFSFGGDLIMCLFSYDDGAEGRIIAVRLVYGDSAPSAAGRLVPQYNQIWE